MEDSVTFLILGAGPTGMGAAYRLKELRITSFLVLERAPEAGGLASSVRDPEGFLWDIGGHVHFSHYPYFDEAVRRVLPDDDWNVLERQAWVWMHGKFVPYPLQSNVHHLPYLSFLSCLWGAFMSSLSIKRKEPSDFKEWILRIFGKGLAHEFMFPYNWKVWAYPPTEMSYQWVGERVAVVSPWDILRHALNQSEEKGWGPNAVFRFPKNGGTGALWKAMKDSVGVSNMRFGEEVVSVNPVSHVVTLSSGRIVHYEHLLSTLPLDRLCGMISGIPETIVQDARRLKHSTSHIVGIGMRGRPSENLRSKSWMYFPEPDCPFYRVTVFSNYSRSHTPDPSIYWSLLTETSESPVKKVDGGTIVEDTITGLRCTGLISSADQIVSRWHYTADYGYPTPSLDRDKILQTVIPYLEGRHIYSRGRFGAWRYEVSNQDHSFMQGVEWANQLRN